jgi:hypothetical protein
MSATAIRDATGFTATMNAVIIYDTFDFGAQANAMLKRATHRKDETTLWDVRLWRADLLKMPLAAETALMEAAEAHLIMLAVQHVQSLLPWLMDWLERWALRRKIQEAALALWVGGSAENRSAQTTREFSQFAENHGLSLIFDDNAKVEGKSSMIATVLDDCERPEERRGFSAPDLPTPPAAAGARRPSVLGTLGSQ